MRALCAVILFLVVLTLDACTKPFGFDVRLGAPSHWWQDGGIGPGKINREPIQEK